MKWILFDSVAHLKDASIFASRNAKVFYFYWRNLQHIMKFFIVIFHKGAFKNSHSGHEAYKN